MELNEMLKRDDEFRYRMLSRMKSDCNYYLGYGGRHPKHLWAGSEVEQIAYMKALWNSFDEHQKPEWLTMDQILDFEQKIGIKAILVEMDYKGYYERFALTHEEFKNEFPEAFEYFNDVLKEGNSHTVKPLVHIFFVETVVGSEKWNEFFTDMEWGLPESDIESGNLAYIDEHQFQSLSKYMQKEQRFYVYNEQPGTVGYGITITDGFESYNDAVGWVSENRPELSEFSIINDFRMVGPKDFVSFERKPSLDNQISDFNAELKSESATDKGILNKVMESER